MARHFPWHNANSKDIKDCQTSEDVMIAADLNWSVAKCPLMAKMPISIKDKDFSDTDNNFIRGGKKYRVLEHQYATYRTDTNIPLGLVKSKYEIIQNVEAFKFFDDAIGKGAEWISAGYFGDGQKIYAVAKLIQDTNIFDDPIENYLVFSNSHDGSSSIDIMFTPIRVACTNMLNAAKNTADSHISIRHTESAKNRINNAANILHIACEYAKDAKMLYDSLYLAKCNDDDVMRFIMDLHLTPGERELLNNYDPQLGYRRLFARDYMTIEATKVSTRKLNLIEDTYNYYFNGPGQEQIKGTAWGAYNAITGYYSNVANLSGERRMDNLLYGTANRTMVKALNLVENYAKAS